jgi:hypothetical protein
MLRAQRLQDDSRDHRVKTYFYWVEHGVAFYYLGSASGEQFDAAQLPWFERNLARDSADPAIVTFVAGTHKAPVDPNKVHHRGRAERNYLHVLMQVNP